MSVVCMKNSLHGSTTEVFEYPETRISNFASSACPNYKSYDFMINELENKSEIQMWSDKKFQMEKSNIPKGAVQLMGQQSYWFDSIRVMYKPTIEEWLKNLKECFHLHTKIASNE